RLQRAKPPARQARRGFRFASTCGVGLLAAMLAVAGHAVGGLLVAGDGVGVGRVRREFLGGSDESVGLLFEVFLFALGRIVLAEVLVQRQQFLDLIGAGLALGGLGAQRRLALLGGLVPLGHDFLDRLRRQVLGAELIDDQDSGQCNDGPTQQRLHTTLS